MENIKSLEETITKVEVPELNNSEYGKNIADKFDNINKNFQTLANQSFIKGDKGENTTIEEVDISNYVDSIGHVIYKDNKPDGWDELLPQNIYLYKNGADYIGGIPFIYMDPKFKDGQIPENESDNSCIIVPNSEKGIFRFEKLDLFPTLYWNGTNFCWKVNGQKTGLIAQGPKGEDGEDGNLYIIRADIKKADNKENVNNTGIYDVTYINLGSKDGNADGWVDVSKLDNKLLSEFDKKNAVVFADLSSDISDEDELLPEFDKKNAVVFADLLPDTPDEDERLNTFWIGKMELIDNKLKIICTENNKVKLAYNDQMLFDSFLRFGKTSSPFKGIFIPFEYNEGGTKYNAGYTFISDPGNKCLSIKTSKNIEGSDWNKEVYDDRTADGHDRSYNNLKIFPRTHFEMPARFNSMAENWAIYVNNHGIYNGGILWNEGTISSQGRIENNGELLNHGDVNVDKGIYASNIHSNGIISSDLGASFSCDGTTHALEVDGGSLFHDKPVFKKGIFIGDNEYNSTANDWAIYINNHGIYNGGDLWNVGTISSKKRIENDGELLNHGDVICNKDIRGKNIVNSGNITNKGNIYVDGLSEFNTTKINKDITVYGNILPKNYIKFESTENDINYSSIIKIKPEQGSDANKSILCVSGGANNDIVGYPWEVDFNKIPKSVEYTFDIEEMSGESFENGGNIKGWIFTNDVNNGKLSYNENEYNVTIELPAGVSIYDFYATFDNGAPKCQFYFINNDSTKYEYEYSKTDNGNDVFTNNTITEYAVIEVDLEVYSTYLGEKFYFTIDGKGDINAGGDKEKSQKIDNGNTIDSEQVNEKYVISTSGANYTIPSELLYDYDNNKWKVKYEDNIKDIENNNSIGDINYDKSTWIKITKEQIDGTINYDYYIYINERKERPDDNTISNVLSKWDEDNCPQYYIYDNKRFIRNEDLKPGNVNVVESFITRIYGDLEVKGNIKYEGDISQGEISELSMKPQQLSICDYEGGISELIQNLEYLIDKRVEEGKIDYINCTYSESFTNGFISININDGVINVSGMLSSPYYLGPVAIGLEGTYEVNENTIHITATNSDNAIKNLITNEYIKF